MSGAGTQPLGRRVAQARVDAGLSQQQLADRLGLSKSWVDKVERGIRQLDKVSVRARLAEALGTDPDFLYTASPPPRPPAAGVEMDGERLSAVLTARLRRMYADNDPGLNAELDALYAAGVTQGVLGDAVGLTRQAIGYRISLVSEVPPESPLSEGEAERLRAMHARGDRKLNAALLKLHQRGVAQNVLAEALEVHDASVWRRIRLAESGHRPVWTVAANPTPIPPDTAVRLRELHAAGDPRLRSELAELNKSGCWKKHLAEVLGITPQGISYLIKKATRA